MPRTLSAEIELTREGMRLSDSPLFLDARRRRPLSFISHAHTDHTARHDQAISTPFTAQILSQRLRRAPSALTVSFGQTFELGALRLSLHPAGHVRGSAQLLVERGDRRILYTGDLCLSPSLTAEPAEVVPCDVLVIESTFGHPRYRLPPRLEALDRVSDFVERVLAGGETPVLLAHALGRSQEVIAHLGARGHRLRAEASICRLASVYRASGCPLVELAALDDDPAPGDVLILPPQARRAGQLRGIGRQRTALLTGWSSAHGSPWLPAADEYIPLSDHSDFAALTAYAEATGARYVYTVHGFAESLATALVAKGIRARPLGDSPQLELFS